MLRVYVAEHETLREFKRRGKSPQRAFPSEQIKKNYSIFSFCPQSKGGHIQLVPSQVFLYKEVKGLCLRVCVRRLYILVKGENAHGLVLC